MMTLALGPASVPNAFRARARSDAAGLFSRAGLARRPLAVRALGRVQCVGASVSEQVLIQPLPGSARDLQTRRLAVPEEAKNNSSLFWFGLGFNIFCGNVAGVMLQSLWGRSLDHIGREKRVDYRGVLREGWRKEGIKAFLTPTKWFSRVLMNAPAQVSRVDTRGRRAQRWRERGR